MTMNWLLFFVASGAILFAGRKLTFVCDRLSQQTKLGHLWIGTILLATITSLPELSATLAAAGIAGSATLAIGNIFGSNLINIAIIALLWREYWGQIGVRVADLGVDPTTRVTDVFVALLKVLGVFGPLLLSMGYCASSARASNRDRGSQRPSPRRAAFI